MTGASWWLITLALIGAGVIGFAFCYICFALWVLFRWGK